MLQPRNLIIVGENAHIQIIERHQSLSENQCSPMLWPKFFAEKEPIWIIIKSRTIYRRPPSSIRPTSNKNGTVCAACIPFPSGEQIDSQQPQFYQQGEHCNSIMKGVTILEDKQHVDQYLVLHKAPNCESHQDYKGIYDDQSTGVFNGKIYVEKDAQKLDAFQQNNNILISDKATINSKPQLEIFADDVKCSHGCTIGQLDEEGYFTCEAGELGPRKLAHYWCMPLPIMFWKA